MDLGGPGGSGFWTRGAHGLNEGIKGQFTSNWEQRRTDPVTARRVPSKWIRGTRGTRGTRGQSCTYNEPRLVYVIECLR